MTTLIDDQLQIRITSAKKQTLSLQLFNEQGKLVRYKQIEGNVGLNCIVLENMQQLAAGSYFLQLKNDGQISRRKLIKQ